MIAIRGRRTWKAETPRPCGTQLAVASAWGNTLDALCAEAQVPPQLWLLAEALRPHLNEPDLFSGGDD